MAQSSRKKLWRISFNTSQAGKRDSKKQGFASVSDKKTNSTKPIVASFSGASKSRTYSNVDTRFLGNGLYEMKIVGDVPKKAKLSYVPGKSFKSPNINVDKLPTYGRVSANKKIMKYNVDLKIPANKSDNVARKFPSTLLSKEKLVRRKTFTQPVKQEVSWNNEGTTRLSQAKRFQLFQALLKEPLTFLDLRVRFGVSKIALKNLVKRRLLKEVWGSKAISVRFTLTARGKFCLKKLEAVAKYEPKISRRNLIRLKHRI